jgi:hypothetical protein
MRGFAHARANTVTGILRAAATRKRSGAARSAPARPAARELAADVGAAKIRAVFAPGLARIARDLALMPEWRELPRAYGALPVTPADGEIGSRPAYSLGEPAKPM